MQRLRPYILLLLVLTQLPLAVTKLCLCPGGNFTLQLGAHTDPVCDSHEHDQAKSFAGRLDIASRAPAKDANKTAPRESLCQDSTLAAMADPRPSFSSDLPPPLFRHMQPQQLRSFAQAPRRLRLDASPPHACLERRLL